MGAGKAAADATEDVDAGFTSYRFDFGDERWHQINVVAVEDAAPTGRYPRVTKRVGKSPTQFPDQEEEGEDQDEGEDEGGV